MTRVSFRVHYETRWGEELYLERKLSEEQNGAPRIERRPMQYVGGGFWREAIEGAETGGRIEYRYAFRGCDGEERREPVFRQVAVTAASVSVFDQWFSVQLPDATFLRQAFAGVIFQPEGAGVPAASGAGRRVLRLTLRAPRVMAGHAVCVSGNHPLLGDWDPARALVMSGKHYPLWLVELPLAELAGPVEFKFGLWSEEAGRLVVYETGPNRLLQELEQDQELVVVNAEHFRHETSWKGAGVAIPVFALRSEHGYGVGEFADLEPFAAWAADCGMHLIQVLPVNDTSTDFTWRDSYPYKAISTAALHPVYLSIQRLFEEYQLPLPEGYIGRRDALNRLPQLDYEAVTRDKLAYLRQLYAAVGARELTSAGFKEFLHGAGDWLKPYAAFCRLRDQHGTADFSQWGEHAIYSPHLTQAWFQPGAPEREEVMFYCFTQFHLQRQFERALAAGHARGVAFKGDLPIGIDRHSVEAWARPELFHMDRQTGAPPDFFSKLGQNWGFPTYNWEAMEADGYAWWRERFRRMSVCFDAVRMDHILGFFRIWEIPRHSTEGILGHFNPALPLRRDEIRGFGFAREAAKFAVPAVVEENLQDFFGEEAAKAAERFLFRDDDGFFRLRAELARAQARSAGPAAAALEAGSTGLGDGLKRLSYEVLFLEDPDHPDRFHPRIDLTDSALCQSFPADEQTALRSLHDDFFFRRHTRFWEQEAMKKLPVLMDAMPMLICGEDLGMIPDSVPVVLARLGLLSLEVQNMPKRPGQRFGDPQEYPYLSVCTTSTHDTPTVRGWWAEDEPGRQAYYNEVMQRPGEAPRECVPDICRFILGRSLAGASMWCILPLQDWLALDARLRHPGAAEERINVPSNPRQYWRYRMHLTIEALQGAADFNEMLGSLIAESGRRPAL